MKKIIISFLTLFFLSSCTTEKRCARMFPPVKQDTFYVEKTEYLKDTIIKIASDQHIISALVECNEAGQILFKELETVKAGKNIKSKIIYKDKIITLDCTVDSQQVYVTYKNRLEKKFNKETLIVKERYIPRWIWIALGAIGVLMLFVGFKISKMF